MLGPEVPPAFRNFRAENALRGVRWSPQFSAESPHCSHLSYDRLQTFAWTDRHVCITESAVEGYADQVGLHIVDHQPSCYNASGPLDVGPVGRGHDVVASQRALDNCKVDCVGQP